MMPRIGFIDYNLDNFHANVFLNDIRGALQNRGFTVAGCWGIDADSGKTWAAKNAVPWFENAEAMAQAVDSFMVLAPTNPETHLALFESCARFGKPVYLDKPFAQDLATAQKILELADRHNTPMQTSSALRYTNVQRSVQALPPDEPVRHMVTWGGGKSFEEYAIHPLELAISCLGPSVQRILRRGRLNECQLLLDFDAGRTAAVNLYIGTRTPFAAAVTTTKGTTLIAVEEDKLFADTAAAILDFFDAGKPQIDRRESLMIRAVMDAAANMREGEWTSLEFRL